MKYSQLLIGGVLLAVLLFLAACSSQPTQTPIVNDTPTNLGTEQTQANVSPQVTVPTQEPSTTLGYDNLSMPKVRVTSIDAFGSRFDAKYMFNQIIINVTSDLALDWDKLSIYAGNKYYNKTLSYNESISCAKATDLIKSRNKQYATQNSAAASSICFSPARDMSTSETIDVIGTYDGEVVVKETIRIPALVETTVLHIK